VAKKKDAEVKEAEDFEAKVAALLKVDPKGIAGKHRKDKSQED
jgi:hypothetical protein